MKKESSSKSKDQARTEEEDVMSSSPHNATSSFGSVTFYAQPSTMSISTTSSTSHASIEGLHLGSTAGA